MKEVYKKNVYNAKKVDYRFVKTGNLSKLIRTSLPREYIPTTRTAYIFGWIFVGIILLSILQFPFQQFLTGQTDLEIKVGIPWTFFRFNALDGDKSPLHIWGLILDLITYILVAYAIEVMINIMFKSRLLMSKEKRKMKPKVFGDKKPKTVSGAITRKVFRKKTLDEGKGKPVEEGAPKTAEMLTVPKSLIKKPAVKAVVKPIAEKTITPKPIAKPKPIVKKPSPLKKTIPMTNPMPLKRRPIPKPFPLTPTKKKSKKLSYTPSYT